MLHDGGDPLRADLRLHGLFPDKLDYCTLNWQEDQPEIAGIDQRSDRIGAAAIDIVIGQIQRGERGIPAVPMTTMVEAQWMDGPSLRRQVSTGR